MGGITDLNWSYIYYTVCFLKVETAFCCGDELLFLSYILITFILYFKEPSTTSTASNYPDVLTRPSLHRSHLNFSMLESPALHCQPSTSSAFPIGSSGFSLVKEIKDSTSQHDDDNISTTSGFSSRASDKGILAFGSK